MNGIEQIINFITLTMINIFEMFDNVQFGDSGLSLLALFLSILFLENIIWFISRILNSSDREDGEKDEKENSSYDPLI